MSDPQASLVLSGRLASMVRTFRSYATVVGVSAVASLVSLVTTVLLARHLSTPEFGYFSMLFAAMTVLWTSTNFGDAAYVRFVNADTGRTKTEYLRAVVLIEGAAIGLLAIASWPAASLLTRALGDSGYFEPLLIGILLGLAMNFVSLRAAVFQAEGKFFWFSSMRAVVNLMILLGVGLAILVASLTLPSVYLVYGISVGVVAAVSLGAVYRRSRPLVPDMSLIRTLVRFSRWLMASNVIYVVGQRLDVIAVAAYTDPASVGQYGSALRIAVVGSLLTGSIAPLMLPRAAQVAPTRESLVAFLRHVAAFTGVVVALIALIWLSVPLWVPLVLGDRYSQAVPITRILLLGIGCIAAYTPLSQLFFADERPRRVFALNVTRMATLATLLVTLTPEHGVTGGAWSVAGAELATLSYTTLAVLRELRRKPPSSPSAPASARR